MSVPVRSERSRDLAGIQRDKAPVERRRERCLDGCYGNRRQMDDLKARKASSSARGKERGA